MDGTKVNVMARNRYIIFYIRLLWGFSRGSNTAIRTGAYQCAYHLNTAMKQIFCITSHKYSRVCTTLLNT